MRVTRTLLGIAVASAALISVSGCSGGHAAASPTPSPLTGDFRLTAGHCTTKDATPTGSYLVVISAAAGKEVRNPQGGCANPNFTPLRPGTDGGVETGAFQNPPKPVFDARRNSRANRIVAPVAFGPFRLGFATSAYDEQDSPSGQPAFVAPQATLVGTKLNLDLRSLFVSYAGPRSSTCAQAFGLGCWQVGSRSASGTYDRATHHFAINWFAGESFTPKGDSIEVHLEGTFVPKAST